MPVGFRLLICAQFFSALSDHALLIVTIALLQQGGQPGWLAPMLKFCFTLAYVVLAPLVGVLADRWPKARLMAWMNALKLVGVLALLLGAPPLLAFAWVGLGAAAYAPAKYGLVTEIVPPARLVRANAWIEVSVIVAVLLGTVGGGVLVSAGFAALAPVQALNQAAAGIGLLPGTTLAAAFAVLVSGYVVAGVLNLGVPESGATYPRRSVRPLALWRQFGHAQRALWRDADGGLALAVTTLFWGAGATLQLMVLHWATQLHGWGLDRASFLQAMVALGVVVGAAWAGRHIALAQTRRVLPAGMVLGALVLAGAWLPSPAWALPVLWAVGAAGGLLVVPMNALLQHRGHVLLGAGRSIAIQGFNENASMLLLLGGYALLLRAGVDVRWLMAGLGALVLLLMAALALRDGGRQRRAARVNAGEMPSSHLPLR